MDTVSDGLLFFKYEHKSRSGEFYENKARTESSIVLYMQ